MNYAENIHTSFSGNAAPEVTPKGVIEHALSLKTLAASDVLVSAVRPYLEIETLSVSDTNLLQTRTLGNFSTRLALGSFQLSRQDSSIEPLFSLAADDQQEILHDMAQNYAKDAGRQIDSGSLTLQDLVVQTKQGGLLDPLPSISNQFVRNEVHATKRASRTVSDRLKFLAAYANVLPGSFTQTTLADHSIGTNDSILVQAFGRNSIKDSELTKIKTAHEQYSDPEMMDYLAGIDFQPGASNDALADIVGAHLNENQVVEPIIQWEVAYALWQKDPVKYAQYANYIHTVWPHSDFYPTYEVKSDSIQIMDELGMYNPIELAHPDMTVRALGILARQGIEADPLVLPVPYDPLSTQRQTQDPISMAVREVAARGEHILRNRVKVF